MAEILISHYRQLYKAGISKAEFKDWHTTNNSHEYKDKTLITINIYSSINYTKCTCWFLIISYDARHMHGCWYSVNCFWKILFTNRGVWRWVSVYAKIIKNQIWCGKINGFHYTSQIMWYNYTTIWHIASLWKVYQKIK